MPPSRHGLRRRVGVWSRRWRSVGDSALLVPVPEADFVYERWPADRDLVGVPGLPLHVTVLYPFLPASEIDQRVERRLERVTGAQSVFEYELAALERFPGIVYISVAPADRFIELTRAIHAAWPSHPPYRGAFKEIVPHVTLAVDDEPSGLAATIGSLLPVRAVARELLLLTKGPGEEWGTRARFALGE